MSRRSPALDLRSLIAHIKQDAHALDYTLAHEVITRMGSDLHIDSSRIVDDPFAYASILEEMHSKEEPPHDSWFFLVQFASMTRELYQMTVVMEKLAGKAATDMPTVSEYAASAPNSSEFFRVLRDELFSRSGLKN